MSEWLRPILGAALLLAGAGGLAYKMISGYQHPSPDAFVSVHDQNRPSAASAADHSTQAETVPVHPAAPAEGAASAAQGAASAVPTAAPIAADPRAESGGTLAIASPAASNIALPADAQDNPACVSVQAEQREIQGALKKQYSPEEGRFMQRRLRELEKQSVNLKCAE